MMRILNQWVAASDGTRLATTIYLPDGPGPFPVVATRSPYLESGKIPVLSDWPDAGCAFVLQACRGTGASEGTLEPWMNEQEDGRQLLRWVADQPWCNGQIALTGYSYCGTAALLAATSGHPALRAVEVGACPCSDHNGPAHVNGVFPLRNNLQWTLEFWQKRQPRNKQQTIDYDQILRHLPVSEMPSLVDQDAVPYWRDWLKPDTWKILDFAQYAPQFTVPALLHTGWYDVSQASTLAVFTVLKNHSNAQVREGTRLIIGPWSHSSTAAPGSLAAETPLPDRKKYLEPIRREYLLEKLTGKPSEPHPAVTYFMYGANEWRTAPSWPPPETQQIPLFLHSDGLANSSRGHGALSPDPPGGRELPDTCIYDPGNPVPSCGGRAAIEGGGPQLQNDTEYCTDVLCYTTEPLTTPLELAGEVTLVLYAATSTLDTDYSVKLVDVHPDGSAWDLADGVMRASYHDQQAGQSETPGQIRELHISLWSIACRLPPGHRLRLTVTFSDFPAYVRNLNTGAKDETGREYLLSRQDIFHDSRHPSHLLLPIR